MSTRQCQIDSGSIGFAGNFWLICHPTLFSDRGVGDASIYNGSRTRENIEKWSTRNRLKLTLTHSATFGVMPGSSSSNRLRPVKTAWFDDRLSYERFKTLNCLCRFLIRGTLCLPALSIWMCSGQPCDKRQHLRHWAHGKSWRPLLCECFGEPR